MSQIYKTSSGGGGLPSNVPTSFTTDKIESYNFSAGAGTAIPSGNNIQLYGDNGIETVTESTQTSVIQVRFTRGETTTSDGAGQTQTALSLTTVNNTVITFQVLVAGFDSADSIGVGGYTTATVINIAGVASLIDIPDIIVNRSAGLTTSTFTVDTSGAQARIRVTGDATKTINWTVCTPGIVST